MKTDAPWAHDVNADLPGERSVQGDPIEAGQGRRPGDRPVAAPAFQAIQSAVEATLRRSSIPDAERIRVAVRGPDVMLTGRVQSWDDRRLARRSVRSMPGVRNVIDLMTLAH